MFDGIGFAKELPLWIKDYRGFQKDLHPKENGRKTRMAKLVIVESPAKAKTIGKYLGDDYEVTASMGHIRDLPASQLGIDVEHGYTPQYISIKGKEKLIKELKSKAKHADGVLLATDPDREGEGAAHRSGYQR